jgi:hypothetical protein
MESAVRANDFSSADMSSTERAARHGQLKQLREMKKGEQGPNFMKRHFGRKNKFLDKFLSQNVRQSYSQNQ